MNNEDIVQKGYNEIAAKYNAERNIYSNEKELKKLVALLSPGEKILDVGCGTGIPATRFLADQGFSVTGIDISSKMIKLARKQVPNAHFIELNMLDLSFPNESFNGITALYSLFHVSREHHLSLLQNFYRMLKPSGILFFCVGPSEWEGIDDFYGAQMFWSFYRPKKTLQLTKDAGFTIISAEVLERGDEEQYWVFARK